MPVRLILAEALLRAGRAEEAGRMLVTVEAALTELRSNRWASDAWQRVARLHEDRGDTKRALAASRAALDAAGRTELRPYTTNPATKHQL